MGSRKPPRIIMPSGGKIATGERVRKGPRFGSRAPDKRVSVENMPWWWRPAPRWVRQWYVKNDGRFWPRRRTKPERLKA